MERLLSQRDFIHMPCIYLFLQQSRGGCHSTLHIYYLRLYIATLVKFHLAIIAKKITLTALAT